MFIHLCETLNSTRRGEWAFWSFERVNNCFNCKLMVLTRILYTVLWPYKVLLCMCTVLICNAMLCLFQEHHNQWSSSWHDYQPGNRFFYNKNSDVLVYFVSTNKILWRILLFSLYTFSLVFVFSWCTCWTSWRILLTLLITPTGRTVTIAKCMCFLSPFKTRV